MRKANKFLIVFSLVLMGFSSKQLFSQINVPYRNGAYEISTVAHLHAVAAAVNDTSNTWSSASYTFRLMGNIGSVSAPVTIPIGTFKAPFKGEFDGNGYVVTVQYNEQKSYKGLFGNVDGAYVHDVTVTGELLYCYSSCGGIVGCATGNTIIENCANFSKCVSSNNSRYMSSCVGGICGLYAGTGSIIRCVNSGALTGQTMSIIINDRERTPNSNYLGGIVGGLQYMSGNLHIERCLNLGTIYGDADVGGIIGGASDGTDLTISNCMNGGYIYGSTDVGGILGSVHMNTAVAEIKYCLNTGVVRGSQDAAQVGGIVGNVTGSNRGAITYTHCYNDRQMCPRGGVAGIYPAGVYGKLTSELTATNLQTAFGAQWTYYWEEAENDIYAIFYPVLKDIGNSDYNGGYDEDPAHMKHVASATCWLTANSYSIETTDDVFNRTFYTDCETGAGGLTWVSKQGRVIGSSTNYTYRREWSWNARGAVGSDILTATCGTSNKQVPLTIPDDIYKTTTAESNFGIFTISEIMPNIVTENATMSVTVANECNLNVSIYDISGA
ncbi:MAG: hypothetical protein LBR55_02520, partial [Bacteroidales bacterium]|nr:hypothetical protein [Bacteroidales bacterium]